MWGDNNVRAALVNREKAFAPGRRGQLKCTRWDQRKRWREDAAVSDSNWPLAAFRRRSPIDE